MLELALDVSLRSAAAAAAVGLVLAGLRVRSGAARHAAWSAVLVTMMTMPVLRAVVPRVDVPIPAGVMSRLNPGADPVLSAPRSPSPSIPDAVGTSSPAFVVPAAAATDRPTAPVLDLRSAGIAVYAVVTVCVFLRIGAGWVFARRLVRRAARTPLVNGVPVFETTAIATPMTAGIVSPCVLLPAEWRAWPAGTLRAVLAHENAHVARWDALVTFLSRVNRAVFWFHPVAWWLERTLATAAEHACDEAAARRTGQPHRYAEVLVQMAQAAGRRGSRVSWQTLGMDGSKALGARIDRLMRGDAMARMSGPKRAALVMGCAAMLVLAVVCRQDVAPLRADADVQKQIDDRKARAERHRAAVSMTAEQAAQMEQSLEQNPDNLEARESLIIYYDQSGKPTWEQKRAGIRKHTLWRIAHLPASDLWVPNISKRYDPDGYAQATKLWLEQTSKADVTAKTLGRAAAFFTADDKPIAEGLLIRAAQMEPGGAWTGQVMRLYAEAIGASVDPRPAAVDPGDARFADEARRKIERSDDPKLLASAASALTRWAVSGGEVQALTRRLLERALALDPQNVPALNMRANIRYFERQRAIEDHLKATGGAPEAFDDFSAKTTAAIAALPADDRLFYLPWAAEVAYMRAENVDYMARQDLDLAGRRQPEAQRAEALRRAGQGFAQSRQFASDALVLARTNSGAAQENDVVYRAETVLGVLALKDGDRKAAVVHMRAAGAAPPPEPIRYTSDFSLRSRLVEYLLRAGERNSVAEYLERSAPRWPIERDQLLKDAARIRAGLMPASYQYAEAGR